MCYRTIHCRDVRSNQIILLLITLNNNAIDVKNTVGLGLKNANKVLKANYESIVTSNILRNNGITEI